jgi:hypothetical protein
MPIPAWSVVEQREGHQCHLRRLLPHALQEMDGECALSVQPKESVTEESHNQPTLRTFILLAVAPGNAE